MSLSDTPSAQRSHIAFFGCTNVGKSSVINVLTNQEVSLVSNIKGTTTDPVKKTMEILPLGPVVIIDTAGIDDKSELGKLRIEKTNLILNKTDIAILVSVSNRALNSYELDLINEFNKRNIPYIIAYNKSDIEKPTRPLKENEILISAKTKENFEQFKEKIALFLNQNKNEKFILKDKIKKDDIVILVIPIDESAPKGRIILPQQNTLRELLDINARIICVQDSELKSALEMLNQKPKLVITDSQAFEKVKDIVPNDILLTSFSILFARYKGILEELIKGAKQIKNLKKADKILISEGCTHHRQCNDIGSVKFPKWIKNFTGLDFEYEFSSGDTFPSDLDKYSLIIHCGGCMLNSKEMISRIERAKNSGKYIVNYGILIAYMNGILKRALKIFPEISDILD